MRLCLAPSDRLSNVACRIGEVSLAAGTGATTAALSEADGPISDRESDSSVAPPHPKGNGSDVLAKAASLGDVLTETDRPKNEVGLRQGAQKMFLRRPR